MSKIYRTGSIIYILQRLLSTYLYDKMCQQCITDKQVNNVLLENFIDVVTQANSLQGFFPMKRASI